MRVTGYQAVAKNCDGSCYVYLHLEIRKSPDMTGRMTRKLTMIFQEMSGVVSRVFCRDEAGRLDADDICVMMLEAKEGYYFPDDHEMLT